MDFIFGVLAGSFGALALIVLAFEFLPRDDAAEDRHVMETMEARMRGLSDGMWTGPDARP